MTKTCTKCLTEKSVDAFNRTSKGKFGKSSICRDCSKVKWKEYYRRESAAHKKSVRIRRKAEIDKMKKHRDERKDVPCIDCGRSYPPYVMDFDHLGDKLCNVSTLSEFSSFTAFKKEADKCEVICSNCHRIRTHRRNQWRN